MSSSLVMPSGVARGARPPLRATRRAAPPASGTRPGSGPAGGRGRRRSSGRAHTRPAPRAPACQAQKAITAAVSGTWDSGARRSRSAQTAQVATPRSRASPRRAPRHGPRPGPPPAAPAPPRRRSRCSPVATHRATRSPTQPTSSGPGSATPAWSRLTRATVSGTDARVARRSSRLAWVTRPSKTACAANGWARVVVGRGLALAVSRAARDSPTTRQRRLAARRSRRSRPARRPARSAAATRAESLASSV